MSLNGPLDSKSESKAKKLDNKETFLGSEDYRAMIVRMQHYLAREEKGKEREIVKRERMLKHMRMLEKLNFRSSLT